MLRGNRNYTSLFPEIVTELPQAAERKGRSDELIQKRNDCLIARYYYYSRMIGYQYPTCLDKLEAEFFLTERTIQDIIQKNMDFLRHINKSKPDFKFFREKYKHLQW
jgi:hypothetical protein